MAENKKPWVGRGQFCAAPNCSNSRKFSAGKSFFRFPKDDTRSKQWVVNCRREDLLKKPADYLYANCVLCADHFERNQFRNDFHNSLVRCAVPTIFSIKNCPRSVTPKRPPPKRRAEPEVNGDTRPVKRIRCCCDQESSDGILEDSATPGPTTHPVCKNQKLRDMVDELKKKNHSLRMKVHCLKRLRHSLRENNTRIHQDGQKCTNRKTLKCSHV